MRHSLLTIALLGTLLTVGSVSLAGNHVAAMRMTSLDAVLSDGERIAEAAGETEERDEILRDAMAPLGLTETDWMDRSRPIVASMPPEGLAMMGWIGAVPVTDVEAALASLAEQLEDHQFADGVHSYVTPFRTPIFVAPAEGYLIAGITRDLVAAADLKRVLDVGELSPGNFAVDLDLVPMTAMIQLGLAMGRQALLPGDDLSEEDAAAAQASLAMFDLYVEFLNNMILNTSRVQLSVEVGSEYVMLHKRLLPRTDSTLAGLLQAQKGGFPELGRRIDASSAAAVMAANVTFTPEFRAATKAFGKRYFETMNSFGAVMSEGDSSWFAEMMAPWEATLDQWVDCVRGDTVASYEFGAETGVRVTQLTGFTDGEACGALLGEVAKSMKHLPGLTEGESLATVEQGALVHGGVSATRVSVDLGGAGEGDAGLGEDSLETMTRMFGGDAYVYYMGVTGDVLLTTAGARSEEGFKAAVDRASIKKKRGGMASEQFEPLKPGPGAYASVDMARVFHQLAEMDPDDSDLQVLREVEDSAGKIVLAAQLLDNSLDFDLGLPLGILELIEELNDEEEGAAETDPHTSGEAAPEPEAVLPAQQNSESKSKP